MKTTTRRGRKRLPESDRKTGRVELRLSPARKQHWVDAADAADMSLQQWIEFQVAAAAVAVRCLGHLETATGVSPARKTEIGATLANITPPLRRV